MYLSTCQLKDQNITMYSTTYSSGLPKKYLHLKSNLRVKVFLSISSLTLRECHRALHNITMSAKRSIVRIYVAALYRHFQYEVIN